MSKGFFSKLVDFLFGSKIKNATQHRKVLKKVMADKSMQTIARSEGMKRNHALHHRSALSGYNAKLIKVASGLGHNSPEGIPEQYRAF